MILYLYTLTLANLDDMSMEELDTLLLMDVDQRVQPHGVRYVLDLT